MTKSEAAAKLGAIGGKNAWKNIPDAERQRIMRERAAKRKRNKQAKAAA